jgi:3D (Asp-Asp-Asp) domain-containing protein
VNHCQHNRRNYLNGRVKAAATIILLIAAVLVSGFVWANSRVIIRVDGKTTSVNASALDPKEVLSNAGVYLGPRDEFRVVANEPGGTSIIEVFRAIPVTLSNGAKIDVVWTGKPTVGEVAESQGYPARSFKTVPDAATRPTPNMEIRILTLSDKVMEKELPIPFPIVRQPDPMMEKGMEAVVEHGVPGKKLATVRQMFEDGQEAGFDILNEKVLEEPKPEVLKVGTREANDPNRGTIRFKKMLVMEATAYTPFDDGQSGLTASGIPARHGVVSVDPRVIPLGTRIYVMGYGPALAADTGGAIKGARIDLCFDEYHEAIRFGRRTVEVYILAE